MIEGAAPGQPLLERAQLGLGGVEDGRVARRRCQGVVARSVPGRQHRRRAARPRLRLAPRGLGRCNFFPVRRRLPAGGRRLRVDCGCNI